MTRGEDIAWLFNIVSLTLWALAHFSQFPCLGDDCSYIFPTQHSDTHKSGQCPGPPSVSLSCDSAEWRQDRAPGPPFSSGPRDGPGCLRSFPRLPFISLN